MNLIVAGSRSFDDYDLMKKYLDKIKSVCSSLTIISGTANGADKMGEKYASENGLECKKFPAKWDSYGKKAGIIRNYDMACCADKAIVFWDGKSKGTKHMITIMKEYNKECIVVNFEPKVMGEEEYKNLADKEKDIRDADKKEQRRC